MTIAAGFVHSDGILLCSDSQMESMLGKTEGPKIGVFDFAGGKVAIAFAGHKENALNAVQKCAKTLKRLGEHEDAIAELESTLDTAYQRLVYRDPKYKTSEENNIGYSLLIAFWSKRDNRASLFATEGVALNGVTTPCECRGIGRDLANYIVGPLASETLSEQQALVLAAYVLGRVKYGVPGCGGVSQFVSLRNDGIVVSVTDLVLDEVDRISRIFDTESQHLLFTMANPDQAQFETQLDAFVASMREIRRYWVTFQSNVTSSKYQRLTTTDQSSQPPSRE